MFIGSVLLPLSSPAAISATMQNRSVTTTTAPATPTEHTTAIEMTGNDSGLQRTTGQQARTLLGLTHFLLAVPCHAVGWERAYACASLDRVGQSVGHGFREGFDSLPSPKG